METETETEGRDAVTMHGVDELKTAKVGDNGQVYVGREFGGDNVKIAIRREPAEADEGAEDASDGVEAEAES